MFLPYIPQPVANTALLRDKRLLHQNTCQQKYRLIGRLVTGERSSCVWRWCGTEGGFGRISSCRWTLKHMSLSKNDRKGAGGYIKISDAHCCHISGSACLINSERGLSEARPTRQQHTQQREFQSIQQHWVFSSWLHAAFLLEDLKYWGFRGSGACILKGCLTDRKLQGKIGVMKVTMVLIQSGGPFPISSHAQEQHLDTQAESKLVQTSLWVLTAHLTHTSTPLRNITVQTSHK